MTEPRRILITGATDGIGLALARRYRARGERPLLLGRRRWAELAHLADEFSEADYFQVDLAQPDCAAQLVEMLGERNVDRLDVVVHNAGTGFYGRFAEQSPESVNRLLTVNLAAPISLTHTLLPWLPAGKGQVVFIGSVSADLPTPDYAVYSATKAALSGFARSLQVEWRGQVVVQLIQPGATRTGLHEKMGISQETMAWETFPSAEKVAAGIVAAIEGKRPFTTIGVGNQLLGMAGRQFGFVVDPVMRRKTANSQQPTVNSQRSAEAPTCVITGAADGIGKALALRFGRAGYRICGVDVDAVRAADVVVELAEMGAEASFVIADLSTEAGVETAVSQLLAGAAIDVLIHNAGINAVGGFADIPLARQMKVVDVNLRAPLWLTAILEANHKLAEAGSLVLLSSLSNYVGYPGAAVYAATKDGLAAYGRSLGAAFGRERHVLIVYPGPTRTEHARRYSPDNGRESRRLPPEQVAEGIFQAVQTRQTHYIPGVGNQLFAAAGKLFPGLMNRAMKKTIYDPLQGRTLT
ncbi:MAG: SDR family NAD(P)-dependent oxidoreductase [Anaerolineae bacterium]|nr:SDR family NAD(P)-dependent oxidoreductase [Anaerolineae bacterium]